MSNIINRFIFSWEIFRRFSFEKNFSGMRWLIDIWEDLLLLSTHRWSCGFAILDDEHIWFNSRVFHKKFHPISQQAIKISFALEAVKEIMKNCSLIKIKEIYDSKQFSFVERWNAISNLLCTRYGELNSKHCFLLDEKRSYLSELSLKQILNLLNWFRKYQSLHLFYSSLAYKLKADLTEFIEKTKEKKSC